MKKILAVVLAVAAAAVFVVPTEAKCLGRFVSGPVASCATYP
jgi:hypothetical protein